MASPQVEDGATCIAHDLLVAFVQSDLTPLQKDLFLMLAYLTYGNGRKEAEVTPNDLRLLITGKRTLRTERVAAALDDLATKGVLTVRKIQNTDRYLVGIQKDYDLWSIYSEKSDKKDTISVFKYINNKTLKGDKLSSLLKYAYGNSEAQLTLAQWGMEKKHAKSVYRQALEAYRDPLMAAYIMRDYIDYLLAEDWFGQVRMRFVYMEPRFKQWLRQIPKKPLAELSDERATSRRKKFNVRTGYWEFTTDRLESGGL